MLINQLSTLIDIYKLMTFAPAQPDKLVSRVCELLATTLILPTSTCAISAPLAVLRQLDIDASIINNIQSSLVPSPPNLFRQNDSVSATYPA